MHRRKRYWSPEESYRSHGQTWKRRRRSPSRDRDGHLRLRQRLGSPRRSRSRSHNRDTSWGRPNKPRLGQPRFSEDLSSSSHSESYSTRSPTRLCTRDRTRTERRRKHRSRSGSGTSSVSTKRRRVSDFHPAWAAAKAQSYMYAVICSVWSELKTPHVSLSNLRVSSSEREIIPLQ
ncbi:hypothetical protein FKM82_027577 [Ascaphus truei]